MAVIGEFLVAPEAGWRRYDDLNPAFAYGSEWVKGGSASGAYEGGRSYTNTVGAKLRFRFNGTKLRVVSFVHPSAYSANVTIKIDGVAQTYSLQYGAGNEQVLVYEKMGLQDGFHDVEVICNDTGVSWDAIDIDYTGRLLHPDEVTDPKDLVVGKRIRCNYNASSGAVGVFLGLGQETKDFIPSASTDTPDGDFYLLMVKHWNRKSVLIADRNVQHSISWDTLNTNGIASGGGVLIPSGYAAFNLTVRLLTGGISSADDDDEWDKYIVNSTLDGTVTAGGDNGVWNWQSIYSWSSTTLGSSTDRVIRGADPVYVTSAVGYPSYGVLTNIGFRPVFTFETRGFMKFLFRDGSDLKAFNGTWSTVGTYPPTEELFNTSGMDSLSSLTKAALQQLGEVKPLIWESVASLSRAIVAKAIPKPTLIKASGDIQLADVANIDSFTLVSSATGAGVVKVILSNDLGATWMSFDGSAWITVDSSNLADVKVKGLTPAQFNALTSSAWNQILGGANKVRFGYYLEIANIADVARTDSLVAQFDMKGRWKKAVHGVDYDYEYPANTLLRVSILTDGGFKVNYGSSVPI
jgi:hypothetical protein